MNMYFLTLAIQKTSGQPVFLNTEGFVAHAAIDGIPIMVDRKNPFRLKPTGEGSGVAVTALDESYLIPDQRIEGMRTGPVETFRHQAGFTDPVTKPDSLVVALWFEFEGGEYQTHEFIAAG